MLWKFEVFCVYEKNTKEKKIPKLCETKKRIDWKEKFERFCENQYLFKRKILCEVIKNKINWIMALNMAPYFATGYHVHGNFFS